MKTKLVMKALAVAAGVAIGAMSGVSAETVGPVTDPLGVVKIPKGAPIHIGGYWTLSGPDVNLGLDQKRGAEIAMDDHGNMVAGHPIKFYAEDSQCNAEGGQTAATKLASNRNIVVVVGPDCSSAGTPGGPILWKAGIPSVATSTTAPSLTAADRPEGLHGYMRTIYNDLAAGAADAEYFWNRMECKSLATIHDGSPYAEQLVRVAENRFKELGGTVTAAEAVAPTDVDMRPVLTRIATTKPCAVYFPIFVAAAAQIVRQFGEIKGLEDTTPIGGSALMAPGFLEAAGRQRGGLRVHQPGHLAGRDGQPLPRAGEEVQGEVRRGPDPGVPPERVRRHGGDADGDREGGGEGRRRQHLHRASGASRYAVRHQGLRRHGRRGHLQRAR